MYNNIDCKIVIDDVWLTGNDHVDTALLYTSNTRVLLHTSILRILPASTVNLRRTKLGMLSRM
jgi:hypothetical protein